MKNENEVTGNLFLELEEADKIGIEKEETGPYSITVDYGTVLTIFCCP
jgi:hypothetical protein